jgi:hypothetical protein
LPYWWLWKACLFLLLQHQVQVTFNGAQKTLELGQKQQTTINLLCTKHTTPELLEGRETG